ncbi:hypothetical protein [Desulfospira joergensenii]|uniref:hypothetical protein n=1 Tax=Desulfospira joergensenii TaxID=53329 RepID=UPI0003B6038B|nr:hypothetical protein [Desulfospira joergensenii]
MLHTKDKIKITYADKGYAGTPNREFMALRKINDGIMRKDDINTKWPHMGETEGFYHQISAARA